MGVLWEARTVPLEKHTLITLIAKKWSKSGEKESTPIFTVKSIAPEIQGSPRPDGPPNCVFPSWAHLGGRKIDFGPPPQVYSGAMENADH